MNGTYVDPSDYEVSPRSTDPATRLAEERIRTRWLKLQLDERDAELADRERMVTELLAELAGIN